jgi:hypothetical protein
VRKCVVGDPPSATVPYSDVDERLEVMDITGHLSRLEWMVVQREAQRQIRERGYLKLWTEMIYTMVRRGEVEVGDAIEDPFLVALSR